MAVMTDWTGVIMGVLLGGLSAWLIADIYFRKSERALTARFRDQLAMLKAIYETHLEGVRGAKEAVAADLWDRRLQQAIAEHRHRGTAQLLIDAYADYTPEQKAELWDAVGRAIRGTEGFRTNPFRKS
jgi:hypothetical protein